METKLTDKVNEVIKSDLKFKSLMILHLVKIKNLKTRKKEMMKR
jgi:hypothetical protein